MELVMTENLRLMETKDSGKECSALADSWPPLHHATTHHLLGGNPVSQTAVCGGDSPLSVGSSGGRSLLESEYSSAYNSRCIPSGRRITSFSFFLLGASLRRPRMTSLLTSGVGDLSSSKMSRTSAILFQDL
ncbi:hypothetical protein E2C01_003425 [Portunus trituberculatus]|uniref:Uncharacterized protein n=1 Tax=Portunus trituberculatus TaxID=210409 RepID=A0A5B7CNP3_PORTR|nr:hypothetical protein [Portunus trituberculatus]